MFKKAVFKAVLKSFILQNIFLLLFKIIISQKNFYFYSSKNILIIFCIAMCTILFLFAMHFFNFTIYSRTMPSLVMSVYYRFYYIVNKSTR